MNYGGDAADQIVRYSMDGLDHSIRLSGALAKNLAVFLYAVLKSQGKTHGKTRMVKMLKDGRPLKFFTVPADRLKEFCREGKKRGLLYVAIRDKKNPGLCELAVYADDAAKVNRVMERMNLDYIKSEAGEAVHETAPEAGQEVGQEAPAKTETVEMPEGEIQFEFHDGDQDFSFDMTQAETENFTKAQEAGERNPSEASSHSSGISSKQERENERPSVRRELNQIKEEQKESGKKKKPRSRNRNANRQKKKAKTRGR